MEKKEVSTVENFFQTYTLNDFLNKILKMVGLIWKKSLLVSVVLFLPVAIFYSIGIFNLFSFFPLLENISKNVSLSTAQIISLITGILSVIIANILFLCTYLYTYSFVIFISNKTAKNETYKLIEALSAVLKNNFSNVIGSSLLIGLILFMVYILGAILIILFSVGAALIENLPIKITMIVLAVLSGFALIYFVAFFFIKYSFVNEYIIIDGEKIKSSISKSFNLVKNNFFKVMFFSFLISIMISFGISTIISPLIFTSILPFYIKYFEISISDNPSDFSALTQFIPNFAVAMGLNLLFQSIGTNIIFPIFKFLFFIDLKIKKNELIESKQTNE